MSNTVQLRIFIAEHEVLCAFM